MSGNEKQILEPIASVVKLALLVFKIKDTKINIYDHRIYYDEPKGSFFDNKYTQAFNRTISKQSRENISVFNDFIVKYLEYYIIENEDKELCEIHCNIAKLCINGLHKLRETYKKDGLNTAVMALQYLINLILLILTNLEQFKKKILIIDDYLPTEIDRNSLINDKIIKKLYRDQDIKKLYYELSDCFTDKFLPKNDDFTPGKVNSLFEFLKNRDDIFVNMLNRSLCPVSDHTKNINKNNDINDNNDDFINNNN